MKKPKRSTLKAKCDRLWSQIIRARGHCELSGKDGIACAGNLQAAHLIGRRFHNTRWDLANGWALCQAHHVYYTHRPEAWFLLLEDWAPGLYSALWEMAQRPWDKDYDKVLSSLKEAVSAL